MIILLTKFLQAVFAVFSRRTIGANCFIQGTGFLVVMRPDKDMGMNLLILLKES